MYLEVCYSQTNTTRNKAVTCQNRGQTRFVSLYFIKKLETIFLVDREMKSSTKSFESKDDKNFRWKTLYIKGKAGDHWIQVSNDLVPVPRGLNIFKDFISTEEATKLLDEIQDLEFVWEGFEQRRKVQRYTIFDKEDDENGEQSSTKVPNMLQILAERLEKETGHRPQHVTVEEYSALTQKITQYGPKGHNGVVTSFESVDLCQCDEDCSCFMAEIPLHIPAVKHLNRPKRRDPFCWGLESLEHWTDIRVEPSSALIQTGECLWNWRSRTSALPEEENQKGGKITILRFYSLPQQSASVNSGENGKGIQPNNGVKANKNGIDFDSFGFIGTPETSYCADPMPPIEEVLTIIVTTSPIRSNPSTEVIERVFETFLQNGNDFAVKCRKVIVCDGFRRSDGENEKVTRRHTNVKQAMRNGICTSEQAENYEKYKAALRKLCFNASDDSPFHNAVVEELDSRHGYGFALRHALRHCVSTPYVIVIQHDRTWMRPSPVFDTVKTMWQNRHIKYVTMSMRSNFMYRDIFLGKYGRAYAKEYEEMVLRLPELNLDSRLFGPGSESVQKMIFDTPAVRKSCEALEGNYFASSQALEQQEWLKRNPNEPGKQQLTLSPVSSRWP